MTLSSASTNSYGSLWEKAMSGKPPYHFMTRKEPNKIVDIVKNQGLVRKDTLLVDIGCGGNIQDLKGYSKIEGVKHVVGVDRERGAVELALNALAQESPDVRRKIEILYGEIEDFLSPEGCIRRRLVHKKIPLNEGAGVVTLSSVTHLNPDKLIAKIRKNLLMPRGIVVASQKTAQYAKKHYGRGERGEFGKDDRIVEETESSITIQCTDGLERTYRDAAALRGVLERNDFEVTHVETLEQPYSVADDSDEFVTIVGRKKER